ncbi:MAG TPA: universal stress protein [Gammaproteobacteria bacterium]
MYRNILCALDLSQSSEATCERAIGLARQLGATLTLVHVIDHFPQDRSNTLFAPENNDPAEFREAQARKGLHEMAERLGYLDAAYEVLFTTRSAWHEIVRFAKESNKDLVIVGGHGSHGIVAMLGSTANNVVKHAPCDVLAVQAMA